jgi:hypothetical protein
VARPIAAPQAAATDSAGAAQQSTTEAEPAGEGDSTSPEVDNP